MRSVHGQAICCRKDASDGAFRSANCTVGSGPGPATCFHVREAGDGDDPTVPATEPLVCGPPHEPRGCPMDFLILGPVVPRQDGSTLPFTSRQRAVLAVLLFHANTVVSFADIIRLVWGPHPDDAPP